MTIKGLHNVLPPPKFLPFTTFLPIVTPSTSSIPSNLPPSSSLPPVILALDAPLLFFQLPHHLVKHNSHTWLHSTFRKALQLLYFGIVPVFCFDGVGKWRERRDDRNDDRNMNRNGGGKERGGGEGREGGVGGEREDERKRGTDLFNKHQVETAR